MSIVMSMLNAGALSLEETADEIERIIYAVLPNTELDLPGIDNSERHEQCDINVDKSGRRMRVRKTTKSGEDTYELTVKVSSPDGSKVESNQTIDPDIYAALKECAHRMWTKVRWTIPFTEVIDGVEYDLNWEIDRSVLPDGSFHPLVKIDIEVPNVDVIPKSLPFGLKTVIDASFDQTLTTEQKKTIDDLFDQVITKL